MFLFGEKEERYYFFYFVGLCSSLQSEANGGPIRVWGSTETTGIQPMEGR
jgi:hypothetical protein